MAAFCISVDLAEFLEGLQLDIQEVRIRDRSCGCKAYSFSDIGCQGY